MRLLLWPMLTLTIRCFETQNPKHQNGAESLGGVVGGGDAVGGDDFADTCTRVALCDLYNRYFRHLNNNCYERESGRMSLDERNTGSTWRVVAKEVGFGESGIYEVAQVAAAAQQGQGPTENTDFRGQEQRFNGRKVMPQGQGNYNQRQPQGSFNSGFNHGQLQFCHQKGGPTETLPSSTLCTTVKASSQVKDCPQAKQKQNMPTDFARLPPATGRVYATTRDQAAKTSGTITGNLYIDDLNGLHFNLILGYTIYLYQPHLLRNLI
ncbi:hypothetical protein Tco_0270912 [Tanacetum coccineum]